MPRHGSAVTAPAYIGICPDKLLYRWAIAWDAIQINALLLQLRIVTPVANVGSPLLTLHVSWVAPFPALCVVSNSWLCLSLAVSFAALDSC